MFVMNYLYHVASASRPLTNQTAAINQVQPREDPSSRQHQRRQSSPRGQWLLLSYCYSIAPPNHLLHKTTLFPVPQKTPVLTTFCK